MRKAVSVPYLSTHPTRIPAGRRELDLVPGQTVTAFELDLATATGSARLASGDAIEAFFSADEPVALLRFPGPALLSFRLLAPLALVQRQVRV